MLREEVDADGIAEVVSKWTGVPVSRLLEGEVEKLLQMEDRLHERVIGQDDAVRVGGVGGAAQSRRSARPESPDWHVPVSGADGRRQDRTGAGAGGVHV